MTTAAEVEMKGENTDERQGCRGLGGNISGRVFRVMCRSRA